MIYKIKTDNYKNFDMFSDNLLVPRSYFIPFKSEEELNGVDIKNERYSSSLVKCLSDDDWKFKYYNKVSEVPSEFDTDKEEFDVISVPSTWQHTGYEKPYYVNVRYPFKSDPPNFPTDCPVGIYKKEFEIENTDDNYVITFLGVAGAMDVFCNSHYVGYSEGSHNTAEFELQKYLEVGINEIVIVNHKWCNGTYLECQDMFRANGIFRDVLLKKAKNNSIYDIEIKTIYNEGKYALDLIPTLKLTDDCELFASLYDGEKLVSSKSVNVSASNIDKISFETFDAHEWSAEKPYLYDLLITLSLKGEPLEVIRKRVGFKHIDIKGNLFYFNRKLIKLLGVNHHDTNPKTGYVLTVADMEKDVKIFKEYNVNCVRTSHYPPDPTFLDLCDEYGIYVVDEADIETHGVGENASPNKISNDPVWQEHYIDRVKRMYERDKNHPSITLFSLGNEAGGIKNQDYCYNYLKEVTDIPVHYEGACRTRRWAYDVVSEMYPPISRTEKIASGKGLPSKYYRAPYYMCEYAHAMGMGAGDLEKYVNAVYSGDNMLGGCIWEFVDHAIYHENGEFEYTYGGDHGEWRHDSNFCVDGLFYPDRTPHAGALQMKNCYRPVRAKKIAEHTFSFKSYKRFEKVNYDLSWKLLSDGTVIQSGVEKLKIDPTRSVDITLDYNITDRELCHNVIIFEYFENSRSIAFEQIVLNDPKIEFVCPKSDAPEVETSENKLIIHITNGEIVYDATTGFFESYRYNGQNMFNLFPNYCNRGINLSTFRAPLDNDMYMKKRWLSLGLDSECFYAKSKSKVNTSYDIINNAVVIENNYVLSTGKNKKIGTFSIKYSIYKTGKMRVSVNTLSSKMIVNVPRFGAVLEMPKKFDTVKYYGLGPEQNLSDFKEHCAFGIYETNVTNMHEPYIKPQESSTRTETRFAVVTDENGFGFRFEAINNPFIFSADHFTSAMCAKAMHKEEILQQDTTLIHIDMYDLGAGSNACGPRPTKEHTLNSLSSKGFEFSLEIVGDNNDKNGD